MKNIVRTIVVGGALVAASFATAAPASAACYDYPTESIILHIPTVCVGYDYCDADICINPGIIN